MYKLICVNFHIPTYLEKLKQLGTVPNINDCYPENVVVGHPEINILI